MTEIAALQSVAHDNLLRHEQNQLRNNINQAIDGSSQAFSNDGLFGEY